MGKKQVKSFYFTCLIIFREVQLAASSFLVPNPDLHLGIELWYFKSLVYILLHIFFIYSSYIVQFINICSGDRYHNALDKSE